MRVILGARVREAPKLLHAPHDSHILELALLAGVVAGLVAYASLWGLMRWLKRHEFKALDPFAAYCWLFGAGGFAILALTHA